MKAGAKANNPPPSSQRTEESSAVASGKILYHQKKFTAALDVFEKAGLDFRSASSSAQGLTKPQKEELEECISWTKKILKESLDAALIKRYINWMFYYGISAPLDVLTAGNGPINGLTHDDIITFLLSGAWPGEGANREGSRFKGSRDAVIKYLDYLVWKLRTTEEKYHTRLAVFYLEDIMSEIMSGAKIEDEKLKEKRKYLISILDDPNTKVNYGVILNKIKNGEGNYGMWEELIIIYSKMGSFLEALKIIVDKLQSPERAESYCRQHRNDNPDLFLHLFEVYLTSESAKKTQDPDTINDQAVSFMIKHVEVLDPVRVIKMLPETLNLKDEKNSGIVEYLKRAAQWKEHDRREKKIEKNVRKLENLQYAVKSNELKSKSVRIVRETVCELCKQKILDKVFVVYPNGVIIHFKCFKGLDKHIDPITKTDFRIVDGQV